MWIINTEPFWFFFRITVNQIEENLPEESKEQWKRRGSVDYLVLLDWFNSVTDLTMGMTLQSLKDALYKVIMFKTLDVKEYTMWPGILVKVNYSKKKAL